MRFKEKRAIALEEHQAIMAAEVNPERKALYQLCWHWGASQGDIANLKGEDVDWPHGTVSFTQRKTGVAVIVHLGPEALNLFKALPVHRAYAKMALMKLPSLEDYEQRAAVNSTPTA